MCLILHTGSLTIFSLLLLYLASERKNKLKAEIAKFKFGDSPELFTKLQHLKRCLLQAQMYERINFGD
jgi:hypothetical protein